MRNPTRRLPGSISSPTISSPTKTPRLRAAWVVATLAIVSGAGCGSSKSDPPSATASAALTLAPVAWNPANVDVGSVAAVVEQDQTLTLFGSKGVLTFTSGAIAASDASIADWRAAALIPSSDGESTWLVGVDGAGRVRRVTADGQAADVSDRYGVGADKVTSIASAAGVVTFLLETGLALGDGRTVTHYPVATPRAVAMSKGVVALADGTGVRTFDHGKESGVALPDAQLVAYDDGGHLLAATSHALFDLSNGSAALLYDAGARTIHQLGAAGTAVWLTMDTELARWSGGQLAIGTGPTLAADARLVASPSGDVWVVSGGQLQRWSVASASPGAGGDEAVWTSTIEPIYAAVCSSCHSPPGSGKSSSNIDLSTYDAWSARKPRIYTRVVSQAGTPTAMPPPTSGFALTDAQRAAIATWSRPN